MNIVAVDNLDVFFDNKKKKREKVKVLQDINLTIGEGEIVAIVGESGCGKTTLGKTIVGLFEPTSGEVSYKGKNIKDMNKKEFKEYRLGVQMVHQDSFAALNPNRTIFQSLSLPLLQNKIAKNKGEARKIITEFFVEVGLTPPDQFLYKYPHQLSGGQRQRILLARALSVRPKLIVADEPVSMVDVSLRIALIDLMTRMNKKYNISFVYITHDLATARYVAQDGRLAVMYLGKIIELNNIRRAIDDPLHPYFQALVAAVPEYLGSNQVEKELPLKSMDMPNVENQPTGCKFHTRCPYMQEKCVLEEPILEDYKGGKIACHYFHNIKDQQEKQKELLELILNEKQKI